MNVDLSSHFKHCRCYDITAKLLMLVITLLSFAGCKSSTETSEQETAVVEAPVPSQPVSAPLRSLPVTASKARVLILHDSAGSWGYVGKEHAMLLENLLGHFDVTVRTQAITTYSAGQVNQYSATFYLGTTYDEPSFYPEDASEQRRYRDFLNDVINTSSTVVWVNHNLWQLSTLWPNPSGLDGLTSRFGFAYKGLVNHQYNRVMYKGADLGKAVVHFAHPGAVLDGCVEEASGQYACAPELNTIQVVDANQVQVHAQAYSTLQAEEGSTPYIVQSGSFWYVGDLPFLHHSIKDRYLAFADLLHDILGILPSDESNTALLRLDQIHPRSDPSQLNTLIDYLEGQQIPYAAAISPLYTDNSSAEDSLAIHDSDISAQLQQSVAPGLMSVVAHGLSHQWEGGSNPYSGITGEDAEFYSITSDHDHSVSYEGVIGDSQSSRMRTQKRLTQSRTLLENAGLTPFAWKSPFDMAGESDYLVAQESFPVYYGRVHYFSPQGPDGRYVGQMFPWLIERDRYHYRIVPENLGGTRSKVKTGYATRTAEDVLDDADHLAVVRGHLASVSFDINEPLSDLKTIVEGLQARGYQFEHPCVFGYQCSSSKTPGDYLRLDVLGQAQSATADTTSAAVFLDASGGHAAQSWMIHEIADGSVQLRSAVSRKCLSIDGSKAAGLAVAQRICNDSDTTQRWKLYGSEMRNRATGQCLDSLPSSGQLVSSLCNHSVTQQWQIRLETKH